MVFSVPSDTTDVVVVIEAAEKEQALPALVAVAADQSDNSLASLYDADFSGACSVKICGSLRVLGGWVSLFACAT